jgi:hypothetical protein
MVRKVTPTSGGWRKSLGPTDHHREFEQAASRALLAFRSNSKAWRDTAISKLLTDPLSRRPLGPTILAALRTFAKELVELETPMLPEPMTSPREPIDAVAHRRQLRDMLTCTTHVDRLFDDWLDAIAQIIRLIADRVSEHAATGPATYTFTVPLIDLLTRPVDLVQQIVALLLRFASTEAFPVRPGTVLADRVQHALLTISKLTDDAARKNPHRLIAPADSGLTGINLVAAYLSNTPFFALLTTPFSFSLPDEQRFAAQWTVAPSGMGKSTLLRAMFLNDLQRDASIIVLDSKGDLIGPIKELAAVKERLVLIEPNPNFPLALNPLDIPRANINHVISLLEYIFSALLDAKMTSLQMTLFRTVLPAIVQTIPNATLQTFNDIVTNGVARYEQQFAALPENEPAFFYDKETGFLSKTYVDTRNQLIWRLRFLMTNPVIKQMFSAPKTKLDIGKEMDAGKVILIDNSKQRLGDEGAEFFGRFFIALVLAAAEQRADRPRHEKLPCFFYIDECHNVIKRDEKIATIIDECRSQNIAMILAHQRTTQIISENVLDALANCAIRMANSDDEAKYLADKLRTDTETLRSLPPGTFAAYVRGLPSRRALALKVPYVDLAQLPRMSRTEQNAIRDRMRAEYCFSPLAQSSEPGPSPAAGNSPRSQARHVATRPDKPRPAAPRRDRPRQAPDDSSETGSTW